MSKFDQIASRIIKEQELIVGPLAWSEARKVSGISVSDNSNEGVVVQNGDPRMVIDALVSQYQNLFGKASYMVCREAVRDLVVEMQDEEIPSSLK